VIDGRVGRTFMSRTTRNWWWSCVLALGICVACLASLAASASAELYPETPPPNGTGDPDLTAGTGRSPGKGVIVRVGGNLSRGAGDVARTGSGSVWQFYYVTLWGLRSFYLHF